VANVLAERIEETLRPIIGSVLASVSVDLETKRVGATPETVSREHLPVIAENLVEQLRLVVGRDLAEAAAQRVRGLA
jgi:ubiquinone biosynthesis protein UbiJ